MLPITKTDIAKAAVQLIVATKVANVASDQMEQRLDLDPDSLTVKVGSMVAGHLAANQLRPITDGAVDYVIARVLVWKKNKKTETPTEMHRESLA